MSWIQCLECEGTGLIEVQKSPNLTTKLSVEPEYVLIECDVCDGCGEIEEE